MRSIWYSAIPEAAYYEPRSAGEEGLHTGEVAGHSTKVCCIAMELLCDRISRMIASERVGNSEFTLWVASETR